MALTESRMLPLGTKAPEFDLLDTRSGTHLKLKDVKSDKATVIMFLCNHCPYVIHVNDELVKLANDYIPQGVSFIAISSNDFINYPMDGPDKMAEVARDLNYPFPYLYDETQDVAKDYDAACTPDFYIFDSQMLLQYRGRLDNSRPNSGIPLTGADLRKALDAILKGDELKETQFPSAGCNIKWKQ